MHYARSDIGSLMLESDNIEQLILNQPESVTYYQQNSPPDWPAITNSQDIALLPAAFKQQFTQEYIHQEGIYSLLPPDQQSALCFAKQGYAEAQKSIDQMISLGIVIGGPPIKKQTLVEKIKIVKNFDQLTNIYNQWTINHPDTASPINMDHMSDQIQQESQFWHKSAAELISSAKTF